MRTKLMALLFLAGLLAAGTAEAKQPHCPLPVDECLLRFELMKVRPWLGVEIDRDSLTGASVVATVKPGGPADRAGVHVGDVIERIDGRPPQEWFATKAGWKSDGATPVAVVRNGRTRNLAVPVEHISEELLARVVGEHMLEAHLAWMPDAHEEDGHGQH